MSKATRYSPLSGLPLELMRNVRDYGNILETAYRRRLTSVTRAIRGLLDHAYIVRGTCEFTPDGMKALQEAERRGDGR